MKLLFLLSIAVIIAILVYVISFLFESFSHKRKKSHRKALLISFFVFIVLTGLIFFGAYVSRFQSDLQCKSVSSLSLLPPSPIDTPNGHLKQGDFYYEHGDCERAIIEYTKTIQLYPDFPQSYNNRAYTNMRLRNFKDALVDLDKAIQLNPNYINALMNRGDIHNYYYQIDRQAAIADYKRVIAITGLNRKDPTVCGHLFLAKHNGWTLGAFIGVFTGEFRSCK